MWNDGSGAPTAPPSGTGGGVATACDTCHEFAPNDDILDGADHPNATAILATFGYTPANALEYTYASVGDHIKHGYADHGAPSNPVAADAAGKCDICHPAAVTTYSNDHTNGDQGPPLGLHRPGRRQRQRHVELGRRTCSNVDCHLNQTTPVWGQ